MMTILWISSSGCTASDSSDSTKDDPFDYDNRDDVWLTRQQTPDSQFKPAQVEDVMNSLVDGLNQVEKEEKTTIAFIPKDLSSYFEVAIQGAYRALEELGVPGSIVALNPQSITQDDLITQQIEVCQEQVSRGVDGMGLAPVGADIGVEIENAVAAGTTVVTFDNDQPNSGRHLYVGTINANAGARAGETLVDLLGDETGKVIILGATSEGWTDGYARTYEAREVIEAAGNTVAVVDGDWYDYSVTEADLIAAMEKAGTDLVGCLGVFSNSYQCADAAESLGIIDRIKIAAFDFEPPTISHMEKGQIQVTHAQRQYYMGYLVPYVLYSIEVLGLDDTKALLRDLMVDDERIDTGLDVIRQEDVTKYYEFLGELGIR